MLGAWGKLMRNMCGSRSAQALLGCGHLHVQRSPSGQSRMPSWRVSGLIQSSQAHLQLDAVDSKFLENCSGKHLFV